MKEEQSDTVSYNFITVSVVGRVQDSHPEDWGSILGRCIFCLWSLASHLVLIATVHPAVNGEVGIG